MNHPFVHASLQPAPAGCRLDECELPFVGFDAYLEEK